jgi:osmotically inducible protein OsmC
MALSADLSKAGYMPETIKTLAKVHLGKVDNKTRITHIELSTTVKVADIEYREFQDIAMKTKDNCPVSAALKGVQIHLEALLV